MLSSRFVYTLVTSAVFALMACRARFGAARISSAGGDYFFSVFVHTSNSPLSCKTLAWAATKKNPATQQLARFRGHAELDPKC